MITLFLKDQKGILVLSLLIYLAAFGLIGFGVYNIWKLNSKLDSLESTINRSSTTNPAPSPTENPSANWQEITFEPMKLKLKFPQGWSASLENSTIFQYAPPPKVLNENKVYNLIRVSTHTGVLIPGFYDIDLFDKIYNLKEGDSFEPSILNAEAIKIQKISSGRILSGQKYVIFDQTTKGQDQTKAFILWGNSIIILDLLYSNNLGLTTFKEMLRTAVLL